METEMKAKNTNELAYRIFLLVAMDQPNQIKSSTQYKIERLLHGYQIDFKTK